MSDNDDYPDSATIRDNKGHKVITIKAIANKDTEGITDYSKEELEEILSELALKEFEKEKEALKKEFEARGLDTFAFELCDTPSKLEKLKEKLESVPKAKRSTEHYRKSPSGRVKLANYSQQTDDDVNSWYSKPFDSEKDLIDFLYEKAEKGTSKERKEANKILNQLFKKMGNVGKIRYSGGNE